jgi:predicted NBD/HSP70 family sugar kinase
MKIRNRSRILKLLIKKNELSRKDIADHMGLTKAAISRIVAELMDENIIKEKGIKETGALGRNKMLLELNKNYGYVLGLSICEDHLMLVITNVLGETVGSCVHEFDEKDSFDETETIDLVANKSLQLLWENGIDKSSVLGFGIGYIGEMDNIDINIIRNGIQSRLGISVIAENNVRALAMYEMDFVRNLTSNNFLFIKYGPGLGMTIVQNERVIEGIDNRAGEIGHTIMDSAADTSCRCGRKGCLESLISEKGIIKDIEKIGGSYDSLILSKNLSVIDYGQVSKMIERKDQLILSIFEKRLDYLAKTIANTMILFDPGFVCVYGAIFKQKTILEMIIRKINAFIAEDIESKIIVSDLDPDNMALGSATLVIRNIFFNSGGYRTAQKTQVV